MSDTGLIVNSSMATAVIRAVGGAPNVLVVDADELLQALLARALSSSGFSVTRATTVAEAMSRIHEALPDVIVSDVDLPDTDGLQFGRMLRSDPALRTIPLVYLSARAGTADVVAGLRAGADDYITRPFTVPELVARLRAKVERRPVPVELLPEDPRTGLTTPARLQEQLDRELSRSGHGAHRGAVAVIEFPELAALHDRFGARTLQVLIGQIGTVLSADGTATDVAGRDHESFRILLPQLDQPAVEQRLTDLADSLAATEFGVARERIRLTPVIGYTALDDTVGATELLERAQQAAAAAALHLDLRPQAWTHQLAAQASRTAPRRAPAARRLSLRTPLQIVATFLLGMGLPFLAYLLLARAGIDISGVAYVVVVGALALTGASIWAEGFLALSPDLPPRELGAPYPAASALIAAYLPNEAATVLETVEAFLRVDYPGPLQIVLAYNTPQDMPVEAALRDLARRHPRFLPLRVESSTSKAQNVNAALAAVTGDFVGIFDADHLPEPDSFRRAWRWLSNGYDVVQGHSVVRNGAESAVARMVAVEFESIYAVSHPGRSRLHGFGIFGGSNGFWRTDLLRSTRMRGSMLTEEIDSSALLVASLVVGWVSYWVIEHPVASVRGRIDRQGVLRNLYDT